MGFLFHAIKLGFPVAVTLAFSTIFLNPWLWAHLKFLLTRIGLYKPPPPDDSAAAADLSDRFIFIFEGTSPSPVPVPVHLVTAAIKRALPVVRFADLFRPDGAGLCSVCFEGVGPEDEVRELCRCSHVFHRGCLDTWVDSGRVTCPLCRSMLLPPRTRISRSTPQLPSVTG